MSFERYMPLTVYLVGVGAYLPARRVYDLIEQLAFSWLARSEIMSPYNAERVADAAGWVVAGSLWLGLFIWVLGKLHRVFEAAEQHELHMRTKNEEYNCSLEASQDDPRPLRYGWHRSPIP